MRTTLTLDDDLAAILKEKAKRRGILFRDVVNRTIREGLGSENAAGVADPPKTIPHSFGFRPGIDLDKLGQFVDELEAQEFAENIGSRLPS